MLLPIYLLKRARDFAEVTGEPLNVKTVRKALALLEIDEGGLNQVDRDIITLIIEKFGGGPVGLKTIAAALSEEEATIEEVNEPYLLQTGLIERTPEGASSPRRDTNMSERSSRPNSNRCFRLHSAIVR